MNFRKKTLKDFFLEHSKVILLLLGVVITTLVGILTGIILVYQKGFFPESRILGEREASLILQSENEGVHDVRFEKEKKRV